MTDLDARDTVGLSVIIVTTVNVLLNISVVAKASGLHCCRKLKLKYLKCKQERAIALQKKMKLAQEQYERRSIQVRAGERL